MKRLSLLCLVLSVVSCASGVNGARGPASSSSLADHHECIAKLAAANYPSLISDKDQYVEVPTVGEEEPRGLYLVSMNRAYFIPAKSPFYIQLEMKGDKRLIEIKAERSRVTDAIVPKIVKACNLSGRSCAERGELYIQKKYEDIVVGNQQALEAMNAYIAKMLPGAVDRYLTKQKEDIVLSAASESELRGRISMLGAGVSQGLEACLRAQPQLASLVTTEQQSLARNQEADEALRGVAGSHEK